MDDMSSQPKTILQIRHPQRGVLTIPLKNARWHEDGYQLVHTGTFSFDQTNELGYSDIENGQELTLIVIDAKNNKREFHFFVDTITLSFEQDPTTGAVKKN